MDRLTAELQLVTLVLILNQTSDPEAAAAPLGTSSLLELQLNYGSISELISVDGSPATDKI